MKVILQPYIDNMVMDFYEGHSCIYTEVSYFDLFHFPLIMLRYLF